MLKICPLCTDEITNPEWHGTGICVSHLTKIEDNICPQCDGTGADEEGHLCKACRGKGCV